MTLAGLLRLIQYDEDMLAMVLACALAHAFARHTAESIGLYVVFGAGILALAYYLRRHAEGRSRAGQTMELHRQGKPTAPEHPALWVMKKAVPATMLVMNLPHTRRNEFEVSRPKSSVEVMIIRKRWKESMPHTRGDWLRRRYYCVRSTAPKRA